MQERGQSHNCRASEGGVGELHIGLGNEEVKKVWGSSGGSKASLVPRHWRWGRNYDLGDS